MEHEKKLFKNANSKEQHIPQSLSQPHERLHGQKLKGFQSRAFGNHMPPEMFTQHPKVVNLQPNENLSAQVKEEVVDEDFIGSTFLHQHYSAIEQHKQHQSVGASAVPNGNPNAEDWHDLALSEVQRLRTHLPLLTKAYVRASEQCLQVAETEKMQKYEHDKNILQKIINFLKLPEDRIISYTKESFYRCVQTIEETLKGHENGSINIASKQQPLHGQPSLCQSHINPAQQTNSSNSSSPRAPREIGSLRSEADWIQKYTPRNRQHSEKIEQEFKSSWIKQNQKSTENIQAIRRSGMYLENHFNSKFSPQTHEASRLSQIAERALPKIACNSLYGRASPTFPSTDGLGKISSNVSSLWSPISQFSQETTRFGNNGQLSTTQPHNRLLKAVESISNEALRAAILEISSVTNMEDRITEPWFCEKETHLSLQDGGGSSKNMKRKMNATTLNDMPSPCSDIVGSEPTVTSISKKLKKLSDNALLEEMRNINRHFIETVLELDTDENVNRRLANAGTVLRCSYRAATEGKNSVIHSENNTLKLPVLSVKLLVPLDYPEDYPVFLSKLNTECGTEDEEFRDMWSKATSLLNALLRTAPVYLSLEECAKAWDECARAVVCDYAQRAGGGCFSSRYGSWEDCAAT
ncbi:Mediator of RNA polymerase II transcription subunit 15a [Cucurbita argyrosperma subsp. argyrosperma]|nr:Mediator of RNA polymerase II transcription subunit 15a [Cucurbita argyrosperma subsp. argyrosperma]